MWIFRMNSMKKYLRQNPGNYILLTKWRHDLTFGFGAVDSRFSTEIYIYLFVC